MANLPLTIALGRYPHTRALHEGRVRPEGIALRFVDVEPVNRAFRPMVESLAYDISEMAIGTFLIAQEFGRPLVGLPIVVFRAFHHGSILCLEGSSLRGAPDLAGRRIGVRSYTQTTALWVRGVLAESYGVDLATLRWVVQEGSHVAAFADPPHVERDTTGKSLGELLRSGAIDAAIGLSSAERVGTRPVIADVGAAERDWFARTGVYPVNHMIVLRESVAREHPEVPRRLCDAFVAARDVARASGIRSVGPEETPVPAILEGEPLPYGLDPLNRVAAEAAARMAYAQGLIGRVSAAEEIFGGAVL